MFYTHAHLFKKPVHFAACARITFTLPAIVLVAEEIVADQGVVDQTLQYNVHKTGLAQIQ